MTKNFLTFGFLGLLASSAFWGQASPNTVDAKLDAILMKVDASHQTLQSLVASIPVGKSEPASAEKAADTSVAKEEVAAVQSNVNYIWMILAGALVFVMQAGFAMVELGFSRAKNSINIIMKNFLDFAISAIVFMFLGFGLMFGSTWGGWIGSDSFWLSTRDGNDPLWSFWFFQVVFAGTACTIVSGAMTERTKFVGYLIYAALLAAIVCPIGGHWAWGSFGGGTAFVICYGIFKTVDMIVGLRASDTDQIDGLDLSEHAANAYPDFQTTEQA
jgi:Amt family ammonium transporter